MVPTISHVELLRVLFAGCEADFYCEKPSCYVVEPFDFPTPGYDGVCHVEGEFVLKDPTGAAVPGERFEIVIRHKDGACQRWPALMVGMLASTDKGIVCEYRSNGAPVAEVDADAPLIVNG